MNPRDLPRWRTQVVRHLGDSTMPIRAQTGDAMQPGLDALADHLRHAALYYASADMTALAVHAGGALDAASWTTADQPSASGLIVFEGGVGHVDSQGVRVPVDGLTWGPHDGHLLIWGLVARRRLADEMARRGGSPSRAGGDRPDHLTVSEALESGPSVSLEEERIPPLIPLRAESLPIEAEPTPLPAGGALATPLRALAAAWLLMEQPQLVDRAVDRGRGPARKAAARAGLSAPDVTLVDLRRQYTPQDAEPGGEPTGRLYRHRWVVSGHWRNQAHGPGRELRRRQWIPAHMKGPDGAPLLATERVNVWRR
ncbi:hypothetical protein [Streptomyces harbinensis]|uniref:hypothetical protein n=1 Tax=Streptomyces harbinensis TaxID=1176198 RepID=UPI0036AFA34C